MRLLKSRDKSSMSATLATLLAVTEREVYYSGRNAWQCSPLFQVWVDIPAFREQKQTSQKTNEACCSQRTIRIHFLLTSDLIGIILQGL